MTTERITRVLPNNGNERSLPDCPLVHEDLLVWLESNFMDACPREHEPASATWIRVGKRKLVEFLRMQYKIQQHGEH